jgi:lysophospholipase L1-like esterase
VFVPSAELLDAGRENARAVVAKANAVMNTLNAVSRELGVTFVDVVDFFDKHTPAGGGFFAADPHPNVLGYRLIGETVATMLEDLVASLSHSRAE